MFNKQLEDKVKNLEERIFEPKKTKPLNDVYYPWWGHSTPYTLEERINRLEENLEKEDNVVGLLLKHLGLEYVKITEENGDKEVKETFRKIKKHK